MSERKERKWWSTAVRSRMNFIAIGFLGFILLIGGIVSTFAADANNIFVSTPTHAEAYYLEVNGTLTFKANGAHTCNSTYNGSLYYDGTDHFSCDGSSWTSITTGGAGDGYCDGQSCDVTNTGTLDGYEGTALLDNTDDQNLTWYDNNNSLHIEDGNWVNLSNLSGGSNYDLDIDGDTGSGVITDAETLQVLGSGTVSTTVSGDILTIDGSAHTSDTNANTECSGTTTYFDGEGNCDVLSHLTNFTDNLGHTEDNTSWNKTYADTLYSTGDHTVATNLSETDVENYIFDLDDNTGSLFTSGYLNTSDHVNATVNVCITGGTCLSAALTSYTETDPQWSANESRVTTNENDIASMPNLSLSDIATNIGNWSADQGNYYTSSQVDDEFAGLPNLSYTDITTSIGNFSAENGTIVREGYDDANCTSTDQVTDIGLTINSSGAYITTQCTAQGSGGGMTGFDLTNGTITETITDGETITIAAGRNITINQTTNSMTIHAIDTDTTLSEANVEAMIFDTDNTGSMTTTGTLTFDAWSEGNTGINLSEVTDDLTMTANVTGSNVFTLATTGTFLEMVANPGAGNGYLMFSVQETQGDATAVNFYEGGTGHNRFWDSGSARFGGSANYLCDAFDGLNFPDCDTGATGADVIIQDDLWVGGDLVLGNGTINTTDAGAINVSVDVCISGGGNCLSTVGGGGWTDQSPNVTLTDQTDNVSMGIVLIDNTNDELNMNGNFVDLSGTGTGIDGSGSTINFYTVFGGNPVNRFDITSSGFTSADSDGGYIARSGSSATSPLFRVVNNIDTGISMNTDSDIIYFIASATNIGNISTVGMDVAGYVNATTDVCIEGGQCLSDSSITDTNASTECNGDTTYLDGNGNCDDISSVYEVQLNDEAGLYAVLSDVSDFLQNIVEDTTPQLGGNLDLNQFNINVDPTPTADHSWSGLTATHTAGEALVIGDLVYLNTDGKMWKMDADAASSTKGQAALSTGTIGADSTGTFLMRGYIRDDTWTWATVGQDLYADVTPGNPTATAPSATGDIVRIIGQAHTADIIYFNPDNTYIELS